MSAMKELWQQWGTITMLDEFGLWANQPAELNIGFPKKAAFSTMQGGSIRELKIDDDVAVFIQDCLNRLGERHPMQKDIVIDFYVRRRTYQKIGQIYALSRPKVYEKIRMAEAWIDAKLDDYFRIKEAQRQMLTSNLLKKTE